jgi:hypothetical protein
LCAKLLRRFHEENIKVIRLGLHSGGNVEEGYIAGPYHQAFGELCEGEIYLSIATEQLRDYGKGKYTIYVNPREISKMTGQKQKNKINLLSFGYEITVKGKEGLKKYEVEIQRNER